jgi:D-serine deaminase-like pyridoxal phosphate-dependent protein
MCDLQQHATSLVPIDNVAITVLATVVSLYPDRTAANAAVPGDKGEAMCDAGALAVSKDTGPFKGYGRVVSPPHARGWDLGRVSQEHGTLVWRGPEAGAGAGESGSSVDRSAEGREAARAKEEGGGSPRDLQIGDKIKIVPQHACLTCAAHLWFYVVEEERGGGEEVVDVWVPWKGW